MDLWHEDELEEVKGWFRSAKRDGEAFGWGHAKMFLRDKIEAHFAEARERREHFLANPDEVEAILVSGAERARAEARKTIDACRKACGLTK